MSAAAPSSNEPLPPAHQRTPSVPAGGDDPRGRSVPLRRQPGSAPAGAAASAAARSGFLPLWRQQQHGSVAGTLRYGPVVPSATQPAAVNALPVVTNTQRTACPLHFDGAVAPSAAQTAEAAASAHRSPSQPLLDGQNSVEMTPWRRLPRLQVSSRTNSSSFTQLVAQRSGCFNGSRSAADPEPRPIEYQFASGPASNTSQVRLRPVLTNGLGGAAMPTAATLDALEAMEAGLGPPGPNGGSPNGSDGTRARRWQGWRVRPFRKNPDGGKRDRNSRARAKALVRTRVEPKTFFANERTFLSWLQISVLIMFMGLTLLGGSGTPLAGGISSGASSGSKGSQIAGLIISPVAFIFTLYALFMYKKRTIQIIRRENVRYDDQTGPVLLVLLLTAALVATTVITAKAAFG